MNGPSRHLSWAELACHDKAKTPYPVAFIEDGRAHWLARVFEAIRADCGHKPIHVTSAYRTPAHNRAIGGARNSQHVEGRALDLKPPKGMSVVEFYRRIMEVARPHHFKTEPYLKGIGKYRTFVHVDIRPSARLVVWSGTGLKDTA